MVSSLQARCPVKMYEALRGSRFWNLKGAIGELHVHSLGPGAFKFELQDLLDGQILFEYTLRAPSYFSAPAKRFFALRQQNGTFVGLGFSDLEAALTIGNKISHGLGDPSQWAGCSHKQVSRSNSEIPRSGRPSSSHEGADPIVTYRSLPKRGSAASKEDPQKQQFSEQARVLRKTKSAPPIPRRRGSAQSSATIRRPGHKKKVRLRLASVLSISRGNNLPDMDIGYPTDVKHLGHIGWDFHTTSEPSWMDEFKTKANYAFAPLSDFAQPQDPHWFHDAYSAGQWDAGSSSSDEEDSDCDEPPPPPPQEYADSPEVTSGTQARQGCQMQLKHHSRQQARPRFSLDPHQN
eukprot:SM000004S15035  [mRNA]  locus=s4:897379:900170:+ [translate_table: standard]